MSLKSSLHKTTVRWSLIGLGLSLLLGGGTFIYLTKQSTEESTKLLAQSLMRAFRPQILEGNIRDAQFQMNRILGDLKDQSLRVLDKNQHSLYPLPEDNEASFSCHSDKMLCWNGNFQFITILEPIYFDEDVSKELFGYVSIKTAPKPQWSVIGTFLISTLLLFCAQAWGLLGALKQITRMILDPIQSWSSDLSKNALMSDSKQIAKAPFLELASMERSIQGLRTAISDLEKEASDQARKQAQISIVRQIGHDLKTPLSQISKLFDALVKKAQTTQEVDPSCVYQIERSLKRMGDLIRQIKELNEGEPKGNAQTPIEVGNELFEAMESAKSMIASTDKNAVRIELARPSTVAFTSVPETKFFQIIDNLLRNAIDAVDSRNGIVSVSYASSDDSIQISVKDNGTGISNDIQDKIFDLDFTTKQGKGTGLGLPIIKRICSSYGGKIELRSKLDEGSEFIVHLPKFHERGANT
ncbi:MAG: HAMP domain-containing histidine kinase [Xanthomonadaceae bacterium]|nr:HAMP domain-containing histidine kinase [Xanthomonadaceae bacterium]